jgi:4-diphosphocytidyl-2-C-methyl-D-erythritol kinase
VIAPAKLNLCLYLGRPREDGLHEICSLFHPLNLADRIMVGDAEGSGDEVHCPGVEGPNLAAAALAALREAGWDRPPVRVEIEKRIPIAAGLGGGSADAAAMLRLARGAVDGLDSIAAGLGADVPSQLRPGFALVTGVGETLEPLPPTGEWAAVLIPGDAGLATAEVYAEADRLGLCRDAGELALVRDRLLGAAPGTSPLDYAELLVNDLGEAAISLRPGIEEALGALREAGAEHALVTGSGPTAVGLFRDIAKADAAAAALPYAYSSAIVTSPASIA